MVYLAEALGRQGHALELRLRRDRAAAASHAAALVAGIPISGSGATAMVTSARELAKRAAERTERAERAERAAAKAERELARAETARAEREMAKAERELAQLRRRRHELHHTPRESPRRPAAVKAAPPDPLWARVDAWQQACNMGSEPSEEGWKSRQQPPETAHLEQPCRRHTLPRPPQHQQQQQESHQQTLPPPKQQQEQQQAQQEPPPEQESQQEEEDPEDQQDAASAARGERRREMPPWFATFMGQFQRDLVSEVMSVVQSELARAPVCLCAAAHTGTADTSQAAEPASREEEASLSGLASDISLLQPDSVATPERARSRPTTASPPAPAQAPTVVMADSPAQTTAPAPAQTSAPVVVMTDAEVQTTSPVVTAAPPSMVASWLASMRVPETTPVAPAAAAATAAAGSAPVDQYGLFSVPASPPTGVSYGSGVSVTGVHNGVTVYSSGGGSVETTAAVASGGRPALLRSAYSVPAARPRPRPRRHLTEVDEPDYSCMLVMVEHAAEQEMLDDTWADSTDGGRPQQAVTAQPATAAAAAAASVSDVATASAPAQQQEQRQGHVGHVPVNVAAWLADWHNPPGQTEESPSREQESPRQESQEPQDGQEVDPPVSVAEWLESEPPTPPAVAVDEPELETAVKSPASASQTPPQSPQHQPQSPPQSPQQQQTGTKPKQSLPKLDLSTQPQSQPESPRRQERATQPEPEAELEEGFVTVNGHRLSLSEDDFSDIVIISSPGGSERFELVEEVEEELAELSLQQQQEQQQAPVQAPVQAVSDSVSTNTMVASALSDRWVDAAASLEESGSSASASANGWADSSAGSELLRSTCESAPAAYNITISSPPGGVQQRTVSLPAGARLNGSGSLVSDSPQPAIPERESETEQEPQQQPEQEPEAGQQEQETEQQQQPQTQESVQDQETSGGAVSLMDPLSSLPAPLLLRLQESLQQMPFARQMQLVSALTGRRSVEAFWTRLVDEAAVSGRCPMAELLRDQAARPAGVGVLADSLEAMLRHIKVSAASSSQLDGMGAQSIKHALYALRDAVRSEETTGSESGAAAGAWTPPRLDELRQERQQEERQEKEVTSPRRQDSRQEQSSQTQTQPRAAPEGDSLSGSSSRPHSLSRSGSGSGSGVSSRAGSGEPEPQSPPSEVYSWLASLAHLLPQGVLNRLRQSHSWSSHSDDTPPTEEEAQLITSLVEMGFYDLDRICELYRRYGNNCNEIASHLLDGNM